MSCIYVISKYKIYAPTNKMDRSVKTKKQIKNGKMTNCRLVLHHQLAFNKKNGKMNISMAIHIGVYLKLQKMGSLGPL
jgi:hypothetical protein